MPVGPRVLDLGLAVLDGECDSIVVCSAQPTTYAEAFTTFALGRADFLQGGAFGAPVALGNGRSVASAAVTAGQGLVTGTATYWAAIDRSASRLLAWNPIPVPFQVVAGVPFRLSSVSVNWPGF